MLRKTLLLALTATLPVAAALLWQSCDIEDDRKGGDDDGPGILIENGQADLPPRPEGAQGKDKDQASGMADAASDDRFPDAPEQGEGEGIDQTEEGNAAGGSPAASVTTTVTTEVLVEAARLRLLTPEQFTNVVERVFSFRKTAAVSYGRRRDWVLNTHGVALGGVDFASVMERETEPTAQMMLAMREAAFWLADNIVYRDRNLLEKGEPPVWFTLAHPRYDRPFHDGDAKLKKDKQDEVRAGEERWRLQMRDAFVRLYDREPRADEWALIRATFLDVYLIEKRSVHRAWVMTLMGLFTSLELWTI